ncbi:MAG TPA: phosphate propanoyltransferase [Bacillota bacterium]|nr:phosphate propanoyltransferase [Bacillota bacterium]HPZ22910.1 phosphate propanoyltransferase [Bacillota bacterium]
MLEIPVGVSNRHIHLCQEDFEALFGADSELSKAKDLGQPGQFAAEEKVDICGPKGTIKGVRVLGPFRGHSQVEISRTDAFKLGISPPVRDSGNLAGSAPITLNGPAGSLQLKEGVILAQRHIHMTPDLAKQYRLTDGQMVSVSCDGPRALTFHQVLVRISPAYSLEFHIDTDEANSAMLNSGDVVTLE